MTASKSQIHKLRGICLKFVYDLQNSTRQQAKLSCKILRRLDQWFKS